MPHRFPALTAAPAPGEGRLWLTGTRLSHIMWIVVLVGMGHSVLAMSGEETLAQVNR